MGIDASIKEEVLNHPGLLDAVVGRWFPLATKRGQTYSIGNINGRRGASARLFRGNNGQLRFFDHATGDNYDAIEIARILEGLSFTEAVATLGSMVGINVDTATRPMSPNQRADVEANAAQLRRRLETARAEKEEESRRERLDKMADAEDIYRHSRAMEIGGPVWTRLNDERGIDVRRIYTDIMGVLLEHPSRPWQQRTFPAQVLVVEDPATGAFIGMHTTLVTPPGYQIDKKNRRRRWGAGHPDKTAPGYCAAINITPTRRSEHVAICEGVEDALSLLSVGWEHRVWACVAVADVGKFPVLPDAKTIMIFADPGEIELKQAASTAERWRAAGRHAKVFQSKDHDINDALRGGS